MIALVRLLLLLVAASMVACPAMASGLNTRSASMVAKSQEMAHQTASCHEDMRPGMADHANPDSPYPGGKDCGIAAIHQAAPAPIDPPTDEPVTFVAIPAAEGSSLIAFVKPFATGPPARLRARCALTPVLLKQRLLI